MKVTALVSILSVAGVIGAPPFAAVTSDAVRAQAPSAWRVGQHVEAYTYTRDGSGKNAWRKGVVTEIVTGGAHVRMDDDGEVVTVGNWNLRSAGAASAPQPSTGKITARGGTSASSGGGLDAYRRAVEQHPTAAGYGKLAEIYEHAGMSAQAAAAYEKQASLLSAGSPSRGAVGAAAAAALANTPHQPAAPAGRGSSISPGAYDCVSTGFGTAVGGQSRMTMQSGGVYVDHLGVRGSYTYDAGQQLIHFRGGEKDGQNARYDTAGARPVIRVLSPSNRSAFDCEHA